MKDLEEELINELWQGCGEQLELIHPIFWNQAMVPVLVKMLLHERELKEHYKKLYNCRSVRQNSEI